MSKAVRKAKGLQSADRILQNKFNQKGESMKSRKQKKLYEHAQDYLNGKINNNPLNLLAMLCHFVVEQHKLLETRK